jgi:hypothetical protein
MKAVRKVVVAWHDYEGSSYYPFEVENVNDFRSEVARAYREYAKLERAWMKGGPIREKGLPKLAIRGVEFFSGCSAPHVFTWETWMRSTHHTTTCTPRGRE